MLITIKKRNRTDGNKTQDFLKLLIQILKRPDS